MKWCLVAAGIKDLNRPAEKLSVSQNLGAPLVTSFWDMAPLTRPTFTVCSIIRHGLHMGALFDGHHSNQLQSGSCEWKPDLLPEVFIISTFS